MGCDDDEGCDRKDQPCNRRVGIGAHARPGDAQTIDESRHSPERGHGLAADRRKQRGKQVFLLLIVPGIEPDGANVPLVEFLLDQIHQRGFAGSPWAGDCDRHGGFGFRVAEKPRHRARDRQQPERVFILQPDRIVGHAVIGDVFFRWRPPCPDARGGTAFERDRPQYKRDEYPWRRQPAVREPLPAHSTVEGLRGSRRGNSPLARRSCPDPAPFGGRESDKSDGRGKRDIEPRYGEGRSRRVGGNLEYVAHRAANPDRRLFARRRTADLGSQCRRRYQQ